MKPLHFALILAGIGSLSTAAPCEAAAVVVPNFSFEDPNLPDGSSSSGFPGWVFTENSGSAIITDPLGAALAGMEGEQYVSLGVSGGSGSAGKFSRLTSASLLTIAPETTYELTGAAASGTGPGGPAFASFSLLAGESAFATRSVSSFDTGLTFTDFTVSVTTGAAGTDARVGLPLTVQLRLVSLDGGSLRFDNVRLTATVPEPSVAVLLAFGAAAGMSQRRRKS